MVDGLEVGMKLQAKYNGEYYPAEVVKVAAAKKKAPVQVTFKGYEGAVWMSLEDLKSKKLKAAPKEAPKDKGKAAPKAAAGVDYSGLEKGMRVQAEAGGTYYAAEVLTVSTAKAKAKAPVKVKFVGYEGLDEWVGADRLRSKVLKAKKADEPAAKAPAAKAAAKAVDYSGLTKGTRVQAEFDGSYYAADVLTVSTAKAKAKAPVKVSFVGYEGMDAWLGVDRIRSKALKVAAAPVEVKSAPAKATAKASAAAGYDYSGLEKGMRVQAESGGTYYAAEVLTVSKAKAKAAPVKVKFVGYEGLDEWVGGDRLRSKAVKQTTAAPAEAAPKKAAAKAGAAGIGYDYSGLEKGMRVQAEYGGTYYAADILTVSKAKAKAAPVKVSFVGYEGLDEWVGGDRLRSKALKKTAGDAAKPKAAPKAAAPQASGYDYSGLEKGMRIQAESGGKYYAAEIVTVSKAKAKSKAPVQINFVGYTAASNEWVGGDRIRSKALGKPKAKKDES